MVVNYYFATQLYRARGSLLDSQKLVGPGLVQPGGGAHVCLKNLFEVLSSFLKAEKLMPGLRRCLRRVFQALGKATYCQRLACWHKNITESSEAKMRSSSHSSIRSALDGKIPRCRVVQTTEGKERHLEFNSRSDVEPVSAAVRASNRLFA